MHTFQVSLMPMQVVNWLFDAVPLAGAVFTLTLTVLVLTDADCGCQAKGAEMLAPACAHTRRCTEE